MTSLRPVTSIGVNSVRNVNIYKKNIYLKYIVAFLLKESSDRRLALGNVPLQLHLQLHKASRNNILIIMPLSLYHVNKRKLIIIELFA